MLRVFVLLSLLTSLSTYAAIPSFNQFLGDFSIHGGLSGVELPPRDSQLSKEEAMIRFSQIEDVKYFNIISLSEGEGFDGTAEIEFGVKKGADFSKQPLFLELVDANVRVVKINEEELDLKTAYKDDRILIPTDKIKVDSVNAVFIEYSAKYDTDYSFGLHKNTEELDGETYTYLYTQFEVYAASMMIPCFDQPNIKGKFRLVVHAPEDWEVVSTELPISEDKAGREIGKKVWVFPETPRIPTYAFSLHAGDYVQYLPNEKLEIPQRLFVRQSIARQFDASPEDEQAEWFKVNRLGLEFYADLFDIPYPFSKLDSLLVPDFKFGAMENIGAVTYREEFTAPQAAPLRVIVPLHEVVHHWTGNLVTLEWWDDFWLNESSAEFFAFYAAEKLASEFPAVPDSWGMFRQMRIQGTLDKFDSPKANPHIHPIAALDIDTENVITIVDGISYSKGATVYRQLLARIGEDEFIKRFSEYISAYAWDNADRDEFHGIMTEGFRPFDEHPNWGHLWFETSGYNSVEASFACEEGTISEFTLEQGVASGDDVLRSHYTQLGFYYQDKEPVVVPVVYSGLSTNVIEAVTDVPCPDFVYPNEGYHDYVKVIFDEKSLKALQNDMELKGLPTTANVLAEKQLK